MKLSYDSKQPFWSDRWSFSSSRIWVSLAIFSWLISWCWANKLCCYGDSAVPIVCSPLASTASSWTVAALFGIEFLNYYYYFLKTSSMSITWSKSSGILDFRFFYCDNFWYCRSEAIRFYVPSRFSWIVEDLALRIGVRPAVCPPLTTLCFLSYDYNLKLTRSYSLGFSPASTDDDFLACSTRPIASASFFFLI